MFTIRTRYVCTLSVLLTVVPLWANDESFPVQQESMVTDTVATTDVERAPRVTTTDPFNFSVQNRHLEKGADFYSDSVKWQRHFSFGVYSGAMVHGSHMSNGHKFGSRIDFGRPVGVTASYQFSRLHGVRLLYENHAFSHNFRLSGGDAKVNELGIGYMFDLTNYFKGFDPMKRVNVFATGTVFGMIAKDNTEKRIGARGEIGLLVNYRVIRRYLSLFAEPYLGITTDNFDSYKTQQKYDFFGGIRAGATTDLGTFTYFADHVRSVKTDLYKPRYWWNNVFFGSSYGRMWTNAKSPFGKNWVDSHVYVGYRFSPTHALRLMATYYKNPESLERKHHVMGEVDYVINFTNMWRGYYPDRKFRVSGFFGVGARYLAKNGGKPKGGKDQISPTLVAGFGLSYHPTRQISFFVEPYAAGAFPGTGGDKTIFGGARGGFQIDLIDTYTYMPHYAQTDHEMETATQWQRRPMSHFFFGLSGGFRGIHVQPGENYRSWPLNMFVGYRFTPVQSLRLQGNYARMAENILHRKRVTAELDYMVNFTNLLYGFRPKRPFDVIGYVGVGTRYVAEKGTNGKQAILFTVGGDVSYRVYKGINVFLEPYANLVHQKQQRYYIFDYGFNAGVAVKLDDANLYGNRVRGIASSEWENRWWRHLFVGGSGGIMGVHTHSYGNKITTPMNMFAGYRFSPNHGIRLRGSYIRTFENMDRTKHMQGQVEYMLNLTNMFAPYKTRRLFNVMAFWGIGAKYLDNLQDRDGKLSPLATVGVDLALRIKRSLSVFAEPYMAASKGKGQGYFAINYGANLGLALNLEEVYAYSPRWGRPSSAWTDKPYQRLFFGTMAGWQRTEFVPDHNAIPITLFAGYRFNPNHGLRARMAIARSKVKSKTKQHTAFGVDYMFNATNMLCGYNPNRFINFIGFIGLGTRDLTPDGKVFGDAKMRLMGNAGMDIAMRLTRNVNFFVEPYVGAQHAPSKTAFVNYFMGCNAGLVVNLNDINQPFPGSDLITNHNIFFESAYGWMFPLGTGTGTHGSGLSLDVRAGAWIDPIFGARLSFVFQDYGYSKHWHSAGLKATQPHTGFANALTAKGRFEGMFNPLGISRSYRESANAQKFELNLTAGIEVGAQGKKYAVGKDQDYYAILGLTTALQFLYKFHYNTAIFVEPRFEYMTPFYTHSNNNRYGGQTRDKVVTLNAGVRFMRGTREEHDDERRLNFEQTMFFGGSFGGYKAIATYKVLNGGRMGYFGNLNFGFLITPLHGVKMSVQPSWYRARIHEYDAENSKFTLMDYRWLYMFNFSNKYQRLARRRIDVYMQAGALLSSIIRHPKGVSLVDARYGNNNNKRAFGLSAGFLICYNITRNWAITTEPMTNFLFRDGFMPGYAVKPKMGRARVDLSVGTMFKF